jgi:hypothetical protein
MPTDNDLRRKIEELEGWEPWYAYPDWLTDANAAMGLWQKMVADSDVGAVVVGGDHGGKRFLCSVDFRSKRKPIQLDDKDSSFCIAICRLYVAWREAKDAPAAIALATGE